MLLSQITTDPARFQFRETPYSEKTVSGIVTEGIDLAKFDAIPVIPTDGLYIVAGDGHSRFEAIQRLAKENRLPGAWRAIGGDWDIPVRIITESEARTLAWTANLSRTQFTPCEEARVFQAMLDSGLAIADVSRLSQRSASYISGALPLNGLCRDIRLAMTISPDAGGIEIFLGKLLASKFQQHKIDVAAQQELYHKVLKTADLTASFIRDLFKHIGDAIAQKGSDDFLFAIPASVTHAVENMKDKAQHLRRAERGLAWLLQCKDSGVLDAFCELKFLLDQSGRAILDTIKDQTGSDAAMIAKMCAA